MPYNYLVPKDTQRVLQHRADDCRNLGLILGRYIPHEVILNHDVLDERGRASNKERNVWLPKLCAQFNPYDSKNQALADLIVASQDRWLARTADAIRFKMDLLTPLVVGLGGKNALEFGITLHHVTGLPLIPGSALKGLCRNYALFTLAAEQGIAIDSQALEAFEETLLTQDSATKEVTAYRMMFGSQQASGSCIFHDTVMEAPPDGQSMFRVDVMTPHFVQYYNSQAHDAPHDGDNPNPIMFLTISPGTRFLFAIGLRSHSGATIELAKLGRRWLRAALNQMGIGAKTAAGYGAFGEPPK